MLNPIAEQLIHNLRYDRVTRKHFAIHAWNGNGTCNTIGCIAGTALVLADRFKTTAAFSDHEVLLNIVEEGCKVLGIPFYETAEHLFIPNTLQTNKGVTLLQFREKFSYLPSQARPDLDTVAKMKKWAEKIGMIFYTEYTPDRCALALERIVKDEIPYCDWSYAFKHA